MANTLSITIQTASGPCQYRFSLISLALFLVVLCFTLGSFHFYSTNTREDVWFGKSGSAGKSDGEGLGVKNREPKQESRPPPRVNPTSPNAYPELLPDLKSLDDLFGPRINPAPEKARGGEKSEKKELPKTRPKSGTQNKHALAWNQGSVGNPVDQPVRVDLERIPNGSPVPFKGINSPFGNRNHPKQGKYKFHPGVDLFAEMNTPVLATADGIVEFSGFESKHTYGNLIILLHNYGFRTVYAHLADLGVRKGDFVRKGSLIGRTGNSGLSSGPHLHYEVRLVNRTLNPTGFLNWDVKTMQSTYRGRQVAWQTFVDRINRLDYNDIPLFLRIALRENGYKSP
ncbi:MAG: M23 family metallopeptidase [Magnetococcales bacterium]|nr:M23 family metallopeptidase [Magnetococcales bacterium]